MKKGSLFASLLISAMLVALLIHGVGLDWQRVVVVVGNLSPWTLLAMWGVFHLYLLLKSWRLRLLLQEPIALPRMMALSMIYQWMTTTLPFRTGEVTLLPLLKQQGVAMARSLAALLMVKVVELMALLVNLLLVLLLVERSSVLGREVWLVVVGLAVVGLGVLGIVLGLRHWGVDWLAVQLGHSRWHWLPRRFWLQERWEVFRVALRQGGGGDLYLALGISLLARPCNTLVWVLYCGDLAPELSWQTVVVGEMLFFLASQLPIHGLLGVGSFHALFVLVFAALGVAADRGLALAVGLHAISYGMNGLTGLEGVLWQKINSK